MIDPTEQPATLNPEEYSDVTDPKADLDADERRTYRARCEQMVVIPAMASHEEECSGLYDVVSIKADSYSRYRVDMIDQTCECPDHVNRQGVRCKHIRRVALAMDETPLPAPGEVPGDYWTWASDKLAALRAHRQALQDRKNAVACAAAEVADRLNDAPHALD